MKEYDAVVIGAGCGGMTAAVTLAQGGLKTLLLEKHNIPGGCATSFYRGRFEFETSLHQLSGIGTEENPGQIRNLFTKLGIMEDIELVQDDHLYGVEIEDQMSIDLPTERGELITMLQEKFPDDSEEIEIFIEFIYNFAEQRGAVFFGMDPEPTAEKYPLVVKYGLRDTQSVLDEFLSNKQLQICFGVYISYFGLPANKLPFQILAGCFCSYMEYKSSHFVGGSQALSNALVARFIKLGGQVKFNTGVKEIIVEGGQIKGVITDDGEKIITSNVVSNASPVDTYTNMIDQKLVPQFIIDDINSKELSVSAVTVYLGLDCTIEDLGITASTKFVFDAEADLNSIFGRPDRKPLACGITCYNKISSSFSPEGSSQVVLIELHYGEPWLSISPDEYTNVKYQHGNQLIDLAEKFHPGIREHIEEVEIATPVTHARYLSTPGGSIYGYSPYLKDLSIFSSNKTPFKGLYFAGAWVAGGGYQPCLLSGVGAARALIKKFQSEQLEAS